MNNYDKHCKAGIFAWFGYILKPEECFLLIKESGIESICIWWGDDFEEINGKKETHPQIADRIGLHLENAHLPYAGCDALWQDTLDGEAMLGFYIKSIRQAADAGVPKLVFHPNESKSFGANSVNFELFVHRMHRIIDFAENNSISVAIENVYENGTVRALLDEFKGNPYVGLCFDTGHNNIAAHNDFSLLGEYPDRLMALHIHDNNGASDQHLLPYEGNISWKDFMLALKDSTYNGPLMLESCSPFDYEEYGKFSKGTAKPNREPPEHYLLRAKEACLKISKFH